MYLIIYGNTYGHILDFEAEGRIRNTKREIWYSKILSWSNKDIEFLGVISYFSICGQRNASFMYLISEC